MTTENELGIDHLTDVSTVGRGGFSVVYAATHSLFKRRMAVKVLNELTKDSERRRFERECEVMGRLSDHPNVVTVYNAGYTDDGKPYLLMELVEGGSLDGRLKQQGRLPWREAVRHLIPIASALERAHRENILHRDVKPENILLDGDRPLLADFGIASLRDATGATSTHITASMAHTAPETFENLRDERSDQYSLGSTLHTLITGRPPFWRDGDGSIHPMMHRLLNEPAPLLPPELGPPALAAILQRCLAKRPEDRYPTVADLRVALEALLRGDGAEPPADPDLDRLPGGAPAPSAASEPPSWLSSPVVGAPSSEPSWAPTPTMGTPFSSPEPSGFTPPATSPFGPGGPSSPYTSGWGTPTPTPPLAAPWDSSQPLAGVGVPPAVWSGAGPVVGGPVPAGAAPRLVARSIDYGVWFALWVVAILPFPSGDGIDGATSYVSLLASSSIATALIVLYETIMVGATGATVGKLLLGLRVVGIDGSRVEYGTAFRRQWLNLAIGLLTALAYLPLLLGIILAVVALVMIAGNDGPRQAPWDRLARTMVIGR